MAAAQAGYTKAFDVLEGFEGAMVDGLRVKGAPNLDLLPPGRGILLVEFGFDDASAAQAQAEKGSAGTTRR